MRVCIGVLVTLFAIACNHESPTEPPNNTPARAELTGRTIDAAHTAVGQVTVTLLSSDVIAATTVSRTDGSFTFSDLAPGFYGVKYRVNGAAEEFGGVVKLLSGTNVHDVLVSNCRVPYGTVRDAVTGRPIAGAKVSIYFHETTTDANGHYQIDFGCDVVQGGTIIMSAEHPAYQKSETLTRASLLCTCAYDFLLTPQ